MSRKWRVAVSAIARGTAVVSNRSCKRLQARLNPVTHVLVWAALLLSPLAWAGQEADSTDRPMPTFRFEKPVGFLKTGGSLFTPNSMYHAFVKIVYFRPFRGKLEDEVNGPLMREWVRELDRQVQYLSPPKREKTTVPGAESAMVSVFQEDYYGTPCINLQLAVVASHAIGVIYVWGYHDAWEYYHDSLGAFLTSVRVESEDKAPAASSSPQQNAARKAFAGLYLGQWMMSTRFYLFSEDGRFYRGQRLPSAPGGDIRRFNYQRAREEDPDNSGTYKITGKELVIQLPGEDPIRVDLQGENALKIEGITYKRMDLSK